jgi:hypothetical protein
MPVPLAIASQTSIGRKIISGLAIAIILLVFMIIMTIAGMISKTNQNQSGQGIFSPSSLAVSDIPANVLPLYLDAGQTYGIDWAILAAIGSIETNHCRSTAQGVHSGENSAGAGGCMQFLQATFDAHAVDGNHDGVKSRYDIEDAIPTAAVLLKASGAPDNYNKAIFSYNHADWYVAKVLAKATEYRGALASGGSPSLAATTQNAQDVLKLVIGPAPRITLTSAQRNDLSTGQIDSRVTSLLVAIGRSHTIQVSSLKSEHSLMTTSGNISNHSVGRAVDIGIIDGEVCNSTVHGPFGKCWQLGREIAKMTGPIHPTELIYGLDLDGPGPAFACLSSSCGGDHSTHIHAGYDK